jgi:hypothetical protein
MINLAGVKTADVSIQEELILANIPIKKVELGRTEVPYTLVGESGDWKFNRAWTYWVAFVGGGSDVIGDGKGLPLEIASQLHERKYPIIGEKQPVIYGMVVRVTGHCGFPHPREWAFPTREVLEEESKIIGKDWKEINYGNLAKMCNDGVIVGERFVNYYHIDTQLGLNEFARVIRG